MIFHMSSLSKRTASCTLNTVLSERELNVDEVYVGEHFKIHIFLVALLTKAYLQWGFTPRFIHLQALLADHKHFYVSIQYVVRL